MGRIFPILNNIPVVLRYGMLPYVTVKYLMKVKLDGKNAWKIFKRDRLCHASPNSAQTESVMAGALQVQLAGDAWYFGKKHEKPTIGDPIRPVEIADIARANRLLYAASALGMIVFNGIKIILLLLLL